MSGIAEVRADLADVQRAAERAYIALSRVRIDRAPLNRPVMGLEQITRIAAAAAAIIFVMFVAHMAA